jgi:RNA polymerase sigma-70 factor, ECF subfamily
MSMVSAQSEPAGLPPPRSPAELVAQVAVGDRQAEADLCRRFAPAVRAFARRRLRGTAIDEFTQDVMLLFVEALRTGAVREAERVGGFVLGICRNLARERARLNERRELLWAQYGAPLFVLEEDAPERLPREALLLEDCLSKLARRARHIVILTYAEGLADVEIARRVEASEGNVRVVRHRALKALRQCMSGANTWEAA